MATVDTGAEVSVLPSRVYKQLYPNSVDSDGEIQGLGACSMKLTAFNHTNINVMGQIRLPVKHRDVVKNINFIVTNIDTATIIGRNDAVDLHCVKFLCDNCDQCNDDNMCIKSSSTSFNTDSAKLKWKHALPLGDDPKSKIIDLFPELFKGVGCVDTLYSIELEPDAIPVKHAPRRVPEAIKPKVKDELDRLVCEGIIMPVEVLRLPIR